MGKRKDITGKRFGKLIATEYVGLRERDNRALWLCRCDCGNVVTAAVDVLSRGSVTSCGCKQKLGENRRNLRHGATGTRLYRIWKGMKNRCYYPTQSRYALYGGRGITICDEWLHSFEAFRDWAISNGYRDDLTIDRMDNDKGYNPENCRWATYQEQIHNRRTF